MYDHDRAHANVCGYLVGLDGDQIAYSTQASEAVSLLSRDKFACTCRAKILRVKYGIEDKLYYANI